METNNNLEMTLCVICKNPMPLLRKEKFGYDFCINCSKVSPKKGVSFSYGEREDTWDEIVIMDDDQYQIYKNTEKAFQKLK